ncbi:pentapeptide repeat-containing protein [Laspinema sp. D1]|jgi:uncharacterized protein YjbI with pentapeptide repeats|uniref:pentapeptide repeat-containing protein n=1 Tax=Laspinema palackyanum TaxID=3231601 RepID=UPI00348EC2B5|nr:pentapeptide repeat-containing protein [Laspinema sp. D2b]
MNQFYIPLEELLERYQAGERDFAGISLYSQAKKWLIDADLTGINLSGADLSHIYLIRTKLTGACLRGTDFLYSCLSSVNLSYADLSYANLRRCYWVNVDLNHASMTQSVFFESYLKDVNLSDANLEEMLWIHSCLKGAIKPDPFRLGGAFIWNSMMPDGSMDEGPHFVDYPH